jgi:hypothetical protein
MQSAPVLELGVDLDARDGVLGSRMLPWVNA